MVLNPLFLGGVWFIIHRYSVFHTFIWSGWVGGLSQMKQTSFEKNQSHFETIPKMIQCFTLSPLMHLYKSNYLPLLT